jgi:hypothetical protein
VVHWTQELAMVRIEKLVMMQTEEPEAVLVFAVLCVA